jgi:multiple sugar transport system substrate-binding protein
LNVLMGGTTLYYNKTAFQNAGLEDPYELYLRGEWTWDKLREDAIRLTKHSADGRPERFGVQIPSFPTYMPIVWAFGGDILSLDAKICLLDSPEAIRGLQFLADLRWKDHAAPTPSQGALSAFTFESGKIAMVFDWMGMSPRYRDNIRDFEWDICPLPSGPAGNATPLKGNQLVMYRETAHPEAAWKFMRFLTSRETEKVLYGDARRRAIPTRQSVAASPEFLVPNKPPYHVKAFLRPLENGREFPINPRWSEWTTVLTADLDDLWQGREKDAGVVLRRVVPKINAILSSEEGF